MSKTETVNIGCFGWAFWLGIFILIILFTGKPDLHDALIEYIRNTK